MKTLRLILLSTSIYVLSSFGGCENEIDLTEESGSEVHRIMYGTSFGFCGGYCITELDINENSANYLKYSWTDDLSYPDITCSATVHDWNGLVAIVDLEAFSELEETIGCPDCADGGAEWIEIFANDSSKRVTFEYNKAPAVLDELSVSLRTLSDSFEDCE